MNWSSAGLIDFIPTFFNGELYYLYMIKFIFLCIVDIKFFFCFFMYLITFHILNSISKNFNSYNKTYVNNYL